MEEKIVIVLNEMSEYLSITQMKKLQEVIIKTFADNEASKVEISNEEFLKMFLDAKRIEGCSERTIIYYQAINTKHLACLTPNTEIVDSYFLVNAFQIHPLIRHQLESQCKGAIMDGLNLTIIKGLKFKLPPIKLQRKFVEFYNQVDKSKVVA